MSRRLLVAIVALVVASVQGVVTLAPWGEAFELRFLDLWFNLRGPVAAPAGVTVIRMDEESYRTLDIPLNQPWPRSLHARLLNRLSSTPPRRVVFDVLFLDPGPDPAGDAALAQALGRVPTVIGVDVALSEGEGYSQRGLLTPLPEFSEQVEQLAFVGLPDDEGVIRRFLVDRPALVAHLPSLAGSGAGPGRPDEPGPRDFINYYGPPGTIRSLSYYQVLEEDEPLPPERATELFADQLIYVGLSQKTDLGAAAKDAFVSPYSGAGRMYGVEIHATAAANLLERSWIRRWSAPIEAGALALSAGLVAALLLAVTPPTGALLLFTGILGWGSAAFLLFLNHRFLPGATLALLTAPVTYLASTLYYYVMTRRRQRHLQRAFQLYISPEMAEAVARNPAALKLGGEKLEATALFTDIAGFTDIAEKLEAEEVARMLNSYFSEVMNEIFEQRGTLIKFIGDAVFALWGAPLRDPEHAHHALVAARAIQQEVARFNATGRFPPLHTRIGLHTGLMVVGNLGSSRRFDFTAIGDSVNLASRVEGLNKYFGTSLLLTESVRAKLPTTIELLQVARVRVVGRATPVQLYTPVEGFSRGDLVGWAAGLESFSARRWGDARREFEQLTSHPVLGTGAHLFLRTIERYEVHSPEPGWSGELDFASK